MILDPRDLPDRIDAENDTMLDALTRDERLARGAAAKDERQSDDRLKRIALRAPRRRGVGFPAGDAAIKVEDADDRFRCDARPIVSDADGVVTDSDDDHGRDICFLTSIDRVVPQLLEDHKRPLGRDMARLVRQLPLGAEFREPRGAEDLSLENLGTVTSPPSVPARSRALLGD